MEVLNGQVIFTSKTNIDFKDYKDLSVVSVRDYIDVLTAFSDSSAFGASSVNTVWRPSSVIWTVLKVFSPSDKY